MDLIHIVIVLIVVGVLLWLVNSYIPMAAPFPRLITAVVVIVTVLWLLSLFWNGLPDFGSFGHYRR
jgi:hypothetical protein